MNYEDPHANVSLPVFGIHGNHDDPAGERNLSAMDVLSTAGLINYFGKHALSGGSVGTVDLKPVLMRKGSTKVALYGLGYIRDNRLHQMFNVKDAVVWHRPGETKESSSSSWFNVMLIHQNRASHSKNAISERYLPNWLDFVVWGHEHECLVEPTESAQGFHVSQPGSSVVTSLIEGEAIPFSTVEDCRAFFRGCTSRVDVVLAPQRLRDDGRPPKSLVSVNEAPYLPYWDTDTPPRRLAPQFRSAGVGYIRLGDDMSRNGLSFISCDAASFLLDAGHACLLYTSDAADE